MNVAKCYEENGNNLQFWCCRHVLGVLHFNENLHRIPQTTKDGKIYYNVKYPKYKLGEEIVKEVAVPPTYGIK